MTRTQRLIQVMTWKNCLLILGVLLLAINLIKSLKPLPTEAQTQTPMPSAAPAITPNNGGTPRTLPLTFNVSEPGDVKVRQGQIITAGQAIADRTKERRILENQRKRIELAIQKLETNEVLPVPSPPPPPAMAELPAPTFVDQQAELDKARLEVAQAQESVSLQQRKLAVLETIPQHEIPEAVIPHESRLQDKIYSELDQANAQLKIAMAKLEEAKAAREYLEYQHSLKRADREAQQNQQILEYQRQKQEEAGRLEQRQVEVANLTIKLQETEAKLQELSTIRSPYPGKVQRVRFLKQENNLLNVEVLIVIDKAGGDL